MTSQSAKVVVGAVIYKRGQFWTIISIFSRRYGPCLNIYTIGRIKNEKTRQSTPLYYLDDFSKNKNCCASHDLQAWSILEHYLPFPMSFSLYNSKGKKKNPQRIISL